MDFHLITIVLLCATGSRAEQACTTPNQENAQCISLFSCPTLLAGLLTQTNVSKEFVRKSNCGGTCLEPLVCCGSSANFTETANKKHNDTKTNRKSLLPSKRFCGLQHIDDYERSSNETGISEFPWLAQIEYADSQNQSIRRYVCVGTLINTRYILTTAHCLVNMNSIPVGIRLGEYNVRNDTDCVHDFEIEECSTPVEDYGIEKITLHPNFTYQRDDVALIRLNTSVTYSDYIRPVCLPTREVKPIQTGDTFISSGWGRSKSLKGDVDVKKRITSRSITHEECIEKAGGLVEVFDTHLCTVIDDNSNEAQCLGDSGGPVLFSRNAQWFQAGIISIGSRVCGTDFPEINTRVESYIDWIEETMEP